MAKSQEKKLNKEQLAAVKHGQGPLLIIAGAGTGKTTVITERIKYLITKKLAKPSEILALTFTDKAAREMEERVDLALPYGYTQMWIATFHSFCDQILRQEALRIGLSSDYHLMTQSEATQFLINHLFQFDLKYFRPRGNPTKFVDGLLQHFSRLKDEDVSVKDYLRWAQSQKEEEYLELAKAYQDYEGAKIKENLLDFGDLITHTLRLFRTRKNILKNYQKQFKYFLVDEFQDTNIAQYDLLKLLAPPKKNPNLTAVGDDSQSIYKFRGAAVSNILQFMEDYKKAKQVVLIKNYRSTQTILDHAYQLIKHNNPDTLEAKLGIDKDLRAVRRAKEMPIEFIHADRVENEAEMVANEIKNLGLDYKDIAILVRANAHAEPFTRALARAGIPYQFLGPGQLFRQPEVKDLIAYLKLLDNFEDNVATYKVISNPIFAIGGRDLAAVNNYSRRLHLSLFEAAEAIDKIFVSSQTKEKIAKFVKMVHRHLDLVPKETAGQILYYFLEDSGLLHHLVEAKTVSEEKQSQNIAKFFDRLKTYEVDHEDASVSAVVSWLNLSMQLGESPLASNLDWTVENKVNLLTVHSAKGLEFPAVFLVNLVAGRFPTQERREQIPIPDELVKEILPEGDYHEEEERRLFYVGMTRARDYLFLAAADYYGEGKREKKISPFVSEALGEAVLKRTPTSHVSQLSIFDFKPAEEEIALSSHFANYPVSYLSYSQIETFNTCPLQYQYRYLKAIPVLPAAAASFGSSLHQTLYHFYQLLKRGEKPTQEDLLRIFVQDWSSLGFSSQIHEQRMKKAGERMLIDFFKRAYNPNNIPLSLEQIFVTRVTPTLKIGGKIDRVDITPKGLEIIDYKTGRVWDQKRVDRSLQMTAYALAAVDRGIYGKKPEEIILSFYFLESGEKKSTKRTNVQLEKAKSELIQKAKEMEKSNFAPTPGVWCDFCDYKLLCEAWR